MSDEQKRIAELEEALSKARAELAALRETVKPLVEAGKLATPGPWDDYSGGVGSEYDDDMVRCKIGLQGNANARFIVAARAVADALAGLERGQA